MPPATTIPIPNSRTVPRIFKSPQIARTLPCSLIGRTKPPPAARMSFSCSALSHQPTRYAVLGAGFAGLSVAWHLLKHSPKELNVSIDIYDEVGIAGGASGVSGGLLHPYSPKVKLLWRGAECWQETLKLLSVAEAAARSSTRISENEECPENSDGFIVRRRGILRPAVNVKLLNMLNDNAHNSFANCKVETLDEVAAQKLVPNLCLPLNSAFYMPGAMNVHPRRYLQALFLACENLAEQLSTSGPGLKELRLQKNSIASLLDLAGEYTGVVVCLGARAVFLPELCGKLPIRTCRGVIAHLELPDDLSEEYPDDCPSILADAWMAIQGPRNLHLGSTWEWNSREYSPAVASEETSKALEELLPKASAVYPTIKNWTLTGATAGLRAMPPLTPNGSLPLLGCVDKFVEGGGSCKYWFFGGLGSRGLLYHGWLGKLMAQAVVSGSEESLPTELTSWKNTTAQ